MKMSARILPCRSCYPSYDADPGCHVQTLCSFLGVFLLFCFRSFCSWRQVEATELAPGDVIELATDNGFPADCRHIE